MHRLEVPAAGQSAGDDDGQALPAVRKRHLEATRLCAEAPARFCRVCIDWKFQPRGKPGETMTDMPFPLYANGIYEGLAKYSPLGVPLYITETGIPDSKEDRRAEMFNTYFPQAG